VKISRTCLGIPRATCRPPRTRGLNLRRRQSSVRMARSFSINHLSRANPSAARTQHLIRLRSARCNGMFCRPGRGCSFPLFWLHMGRLRYILRNHTENTAFQAVVAQCSSCEDPPGRHKVNGIARSVITKVGFRPELPGLASHLPDSCPSGEQPGISAHGIELTFE
jgi:hypothetical protein